MCAPFSRDYAIRFSHCDPAGIIFFPQYLILSNHLVEDWFDHALRVPFAELVTPRRIGVPLVHIECDFLAPSRMGETVTFTIDVTRIGRSSLTVGIKAHRDSEIRFRSSQVMASISLDTGRSIDLPSDIRTACTRQENLHA